ncbi:MAG: FkbM family methyltransferase [Xanthobacteraceae bacterium]|jgi:FkbM family methyltransferase
MLETAATKDALRRAFPKSVAYAAHFQALFQNEVELRLLPWLCRHNEVAIDVGAFTGTYTVGLSVYAKSVIAVEPQPWQAAALRWSMPGNVEVVEAALSSTTGKAQMRLSSPRGGSMSRLVDDCSPATNERDISVRLLRLDDLAARHVGFVKIDAEGHELEVLRGASETLRVDQPNILIEAEDRYGAGAVQGVVGFLGNCGYDAFFVRRGSIRPIEEFDAERDQDPKLLVGGQRRAYADYINNFIFTHRDRRADWPAAVPPPWRAAGATMAALCMRRG